METENRQIYSYRKIKKSPVIQFIVATGNETDLGIEKNEHFNSTELSMQIFAVGEVMGWWDGYMVWVLGLRHGQTD